MMDTRIGISISDLFPHIPEILILPHWACPTCCVKDPHRLVFYLWLKTFVYLRKYQHALALNWKRNTYVPCNIWNNYVTFIKWFRLCKILTASKPSSSSNGKCLQLLSLLLSSSRPTHTWNLNSALFGLLPVINSQIKCVEAKSWLPDKIVLAQSTYFQGIHTWTYSRFLRCWNYFFASFRIGQGSW